MFTGRASRLEFALVFAVTTGLALVELLLRYVFGPAAWTTWAVYALAAPGWWLSLAVMFRRMHDLGKSAWLLPLMIVPIVGIVYLVWWFGRPGAPEANRYGAGVA